MEFVQNVKNAEIMILAGGPTPPVGSLSLHVEINVWLKRESF